MNDKMSGGEVVATNEARHACANEPDLVKRIQKAMKAVKNHWMEREESRRFRAALGAAYLESNDEEKERILRSSRVHAKLNATLNALVAGVPVAIDEVKAEIDKQPADIIPLARLWADTE